MALIDIANAMARQEDHTWNASTGTWGSYNPNSLAQKNNNPGNLRYVGQAGATVGQGGFARFQTVEDGFAALERQISLDASRGLSFEGFINKYAPPVENRTNVYLSNVLEWLHITDPKTKLTDVISGKDVGTGEVEGGLFDIGFGDAASGEEGEARFATILLVVIGGLVAWKIFS